MWPFRKEPVPLGRRGEAIAARYLRMRGYRILGRNVTLGRYELDIIASKGDTTAFVEVKSRQDDTLATPETNVDHAKQRHILAAARMYVARENNPDRYYRCDVAAVLIPERGKPSVTYYENAFPCE